MTKVRSKTAKKSISLKNMSQKRKPRKLNPKNVAALKKANVSNATDMVRQQYTFTMQKGDNLASYDEVGGAIELFLPEFVDYFEHTVPDNWSEIVREFVIGVLIHEDVHRAIADTDIKTNSTQDHDIMTSLFRPDKS